MTPVDDRLRAAAWYAQHGFAILPLWSTLPDGTCRCPKGAACEQKPGKHPYTEPDRMHGFRDATTDTDKITTFMGASTHPNWGYVPRAGEFGWDLDGEGWRDRLAALEEQYGPLPETLGTRTPNDGEHRVFRWPVDVERPRGELLGFVARWGSGRGQGYLVGPRSAINGRVYEPNGTLEVAEFPRAWALAAGEAVTERARPAFSEVPVGNRHNVLRDTSRFLHGRGLEGEALEAAVDAINAALPEPKTADEVRRAIGDVDQFPVDPDVMPAPEPAAPAPEPWPHAPSEAAYHGVLGQIALAVAPYTEADPIGVLGTLLAMFGAACGGERTFYQGSLQRTNLSLLLVGETGFRGRKGTALDVVRAVFRLAYPDLDRLWLVGVASGEAIAGHLDREQREAREAQRRPEDRVLVVESEFGRLLTIMNREGSTLSAILRNAWDGVPLGHARARDESLVTRHHVTVLGHITPVELRLKLTDADAANGFANRLLILAVRRARLIPFPTSPDELVADFLRPLHQAIVESRVAAELAFDEDARDRWEAFYAELAVTPRLGLAGAVTGRHEAQVARLALIYALADRATSIGADHLEAAIAVADYARRSATWALGDSTGNRHADVLRRMLVDGDIGWDDAKRGLGLRTAADMGEAVAVLVDAGLAEVVTVPPPGGGRPRRVLRAKGAKGAKGAGGTRTEEHGFPT